MNRQNQRDIMVTLGYDVDTPWKTLPRKDAERLRAVPRLPCARFNEATLQVRLSDKNIADVLAIVMEHDLRVIAACDWVVDMAPAVVPPAARASRAARRARSRTTRRAGPRTFCAAATTCRSPERPRNPIDEE